VNAIPTTQNLMVSHLDSGAHEEGREIPALSAMLHIPVEKDQFGTEARSALNWFSTVSLTALVPPTT